MAGPGSFTEPDEPFGRPPAENVRRQWDAAYSGVPPWDIGRPQAVFTALAASGHLRGRLLDIGCGTGETTLLAAAYGADAIGIDVSRRAVELARAKAARRGVAARFHVADALALRWTGLPFDVVVDSGTFHLFDERQRHAYAAGVGSLIRAGGTCYVLCARAGRRDGWGPPGLEVDELSRAFTDGWTLTSVQPTTFEVAGGAPVDHVEAWLATLVRGDE